MYHRQVFKILLSNKVLEDPRQRRLFRTTDLTELFNLNEPVSGKSESDQLFRDSKLSPNQSGFTSSKIEAMKKLAAALSKKIGEKASSQSANKHGSNENKPDDIHENPSEIKSNNQLSNTVKSNVKSVEDTGEDKNLGNSSSNCSNTNKSEDSMAKYTALNSDNKNKKSEIEKNKQETKNTDNLSDLPLINKQNEHNDTSAYNKVDNSELNDIPNNESGIMQNNQNKIEKTEISDNSLQLLSTELCTSNVTNSSKDLKKNTQDNMNHKSHKKHKKHKKKKSDDAVSAMFEGERVSCLIGRRLGKSKESDPVATADDQYVLSKLFSKAGKYFSKLIIDPII